MRYCLMIGPRQNSLLTPTFAVMQVFTTSFLVLIKVILALCRSFLPFKGLLRFWCITLSQSCLGGGRCCLQKAFDLLLLNRGKSLDSFVRELMERTANAIHSLPTLTKNGLSLTPVIITSCPPSSSDDPYLVGAMRGQELAFTRFRIASCNGWKWHTFLFLRFYALLCLSTIVGNVFIINNTYL